MSKPLPPVTFVVCIVFAGVIYALIPGPRIIPFPINLGGTLPIVAGIYLLIAGSQLFSRANTNINTFLKPDKLVTSGVFRFSRNPMYLGFVVTLAGVCTVMGFLAPFSAVIVFFLVCQFWYIPLEERNCQDVFGEAYAAYSRRTRRWLG